MSEACSASVKKAIKKNATLRAKALGLEPTMSTRTDTDYDRTNFVFEIAAYNGNLNSSVLYPSNPDELDSHQLSPVPHASQAMHVQEQRAERRS